MREKTFMFVTLYAPVCKSISNILNLHYIWAWGVRVLNPSDGNMRMISSCLPQYFYDQLPSFPPKLRYSHMCPNTCKCYHNYDTPPKKQSTSLAVAQT